MKKHNWNEVQFTITAISIAATLGLWNIFSEPERVKAEEKSKEAALRLNEMSQIEVVEVTVFPTAAPTILAFQPLKVIYGGTPPAPKVFQIASAGVAPVKKAKSGGGGGGGGGTPNTGAS